jgi:hypothetical protein
MKAYWGSGGIAPCILLDGGEWSASRPGRFKPRERAPATHWVRRLGGSQSRSGRGGEEKNSQPPRITGRKSYENLLILIRFTQWRIVFFAGESG